MKVQDDDGVLKADSNSTCIDTFPLFLSPSSVPQPPLPSSSSRHGFFNPERLTPSSHRVEREPLLSDDQSVVILDVADTKEKEHELDPAVGQTDQIIHDSITHSALKDDMKFSSHVPDSKIDGIDVSQLIDQHWYDDDEMIALLRHYIGDHPDVAFLDPMLGTHWSHDQTLQASSNNGHNTLQENLCAYHIERERSQARGDSIKNKVIIPVNLAHGHWVLAYVIYSKNIVTIQHNFCTRRSTAGDNLFLPS
jgi:hypothetical protein